MAFRQVMKKGMGVVNSTLRNSSSASNKTLCTSANQFLAQSLPRVVDVSSTSKCRPQVLPCPPPQHYCPPIEVKTRTRRLIQGLWFLTKLGLFVGITKMTIDEGLWGSADETEGLVQRMWIVFENEDEGQSKDENKEDQHPKTTIASLWNRLVLNTGKPFGLKP